MKLWIYEETAPTHKIVRLNAEDHSNHTYLGDLDDESLALFFTNLDATIDVAKNMEMIKYFGYLHLFIVNKK